MAACREPKVLAFLNKIQSDSKINGRTGSIKDDTFLRDA